MRKNIFFSLALLGITLFSCTNEDSDTYSKNKKKVELSKNEVLSIAYDDAKELTEKDIFNMVSSFLNVDNTSRSVATSFKIIKKTFINKEGEFQNREVATRAVIDTNDDITSEICEIEFKKDTVNGLAVVATNSKLPSIIAFIPRKGNEIEMEHSGANELLHASKASYLYKTIRMKELVDSLKQLTLEKISQKLEIPINEITYERIKNNIVLTDANNHVSSRSTAVQSQPAGVQKLSSSIAPFIKTNWGQEDPYNGFFYVENKMDWIKTANNGQVWGAVPVGCVNVALAQIMGYTHLKVFPPTFTIPGGNTQYNPNFDAMTKKPSINDLTGSAYFNIQYLMLNLYDMNQTKSTKQNGAVVASEVSEENMLATMNKYFKYNPKSYFVGDEVLASLRNKNPILMLTSDHAFIISGILITEMANQARQLVKTNDVYWHANFGWADKNTGYYQLDSNANTYFQAGGTNEWCYKMQCIKNIRAK